MKTAIARLLALRNETLCAERQHRIKAREYTELAANEKAKADEYQRAIDLLEAAAATQTTETVPATGN